MRRCSVILALALLPSALAAQAFRPDSAFLAQFRWRSIGPANMTGRVVDIEGNPQNPKEFYVAFATGGIWKTVNAGTTFSQIFDRTGVHATSEIAIAPSDTNVLYVGTGEPNSRNSISPGTGIFKSTDGGRTWAYSGLRETQIIGRIIVHPTDPNTVWVAALGHAWGPNAQRGLYKTTDGGSTWRLVQFISDKAGFVDMAIDASNPNVLYATSWERVRGPYFLQSGGPGSGLWKTTDGGEHWSRISGSGLPTTTWGRGGIAVAPSQPNTVYLILEADSAPNPESVRAARQRGFQPDTTKRARLQSGFFRSTDAGQTWERMTSENNRPFYYSQLRVDPRNAERVYWLSTNARFSNDAGRTWRQIGTGIHVDFHALWIDPTDPDHYVIGEDGGIGQTYDRGRTYDALLQMAVGQFYAVNYDMQRPFWVCGGIQDNGSWCGPTESRNGRITNEDWVNVGGGDGFYAAIDPTDADIVYSESQGGNASRLNLRTWERRGIRPTLFSAPAGAGGGGGGFGGGASLSRTLEDSIVVARGDTTQPATPEQNRVIDSLRARITADTSVLTQNRFNWQSPFLLSPHNPRVIYMGGHRVWKSADRGDHWMALSEDLSTRDTAKIRRSMATTGGITIDASNAESHGTVTTLAESPVRPGILFAGTDDGNVWLTKNDGSSWENLTTRFTGVPRNTWVTRVTPSPFDSSTVYVTFDGHRSDDFHPYVFVSNDFGRTFRSISAGLPDSEYVHVITEDPRRKGLLFLGTEMTAYVSTDAGATWMKLNSGLPPVPVHDLKVHSRDRTLIAGTHGRSIFVMDIGVLEQASDSMLTAPVAMFAPEPALLFASRAPGGGVGSRGLKLFSASNGPTGVRIPIRIMGDFRPVARGPGAGGPPGGAPGAGGEGAAAGEGGGGEGGEGGAAGAAGGGGGGGGGGGFGGGGLLAMVQGTGGRPAGDSILVVVTDISGDTVRTMYTNARPSPLRWVTWDMRRDRAPLGPAARRDSVRLAARAAVLRDSLRTAGLLPPAGQGGGQGGGGRGGANRDPQPTEPGTWTTPLSQAVNPPAQALIRGGGGGGGGGFGGGAGALVEPGVYLVTIRINGRDYRQAVRVERPSNSSSLTGGWQ